MIVRKLMNPSRADAVRLRRNEKITILHLIYAVTILEEALEEIPERLDMVNDGRGRIQRIAGFANALLNDLRVTIPEDQRMGIQNTAGDYEIRLVPQATPSENNVIMAKEEFRALVDSARVKCMDCTLDETECEQCELFRLLTSILPMEDYHALNLCIYNVGKWTN